MENLISKKSLFWIKAKGKGTVVIKSFGELYPIEVNREHIMDTGHIVAFTSELTYNISRVGGYKSLFFSGEGLVCRFSGKGKVWIQTRKIQPFISWVNPFRPKKNN